MASSSMTTLQIGRMVDSREPVLGRIYVDFDQETVFILLCAGDGPFDTHIRCANDDGRIFWQCPVDLEKTTGMPYLQEDGALGTGGVRRFRSPTKVAEVQARKVRLMAMF